MFYVCLVGLACCYGWMEVFIFSAVIWPLIVSMCVCVCLTVWQAGQFHASFPWLLARELLLHVNQLRISQTSISTPPRVPWILCLPHLISLLLSPVLLRVMQSGWCDCSLSYIKLSLCSRYIESLGASRLNSTAVP